MRRPALYSSSSRQQPDSDALPGDASPGPSDSDHPTDSAHFDSAGAETSATPAPATPSRWQRWFAAPRALSLWAFGLGLAAALGVLLPPSLTFGLKPPAQRQLTQKDFDAAVLKTLETRVMPSEAARAYDHVRDSVVRVRGFSKGKDAKSDPPERGVGTGVVVVDKGVILTNLHVVNGADSIKVEFASGLETPASIIGAQPENDLAVLQAQEVPDDLQPATMRSTSDLAPGDRVIAVGFPFGIGPSVSEGVISGLRRQFRSPKGKQLMSNLIQFDAAANPGNSGGPLVTMDGEVVGIVTAILNPESRTFIGIGFAVPIENAAAAVGQSPF